MAIVKLNSNNDDTGIFSKFNNIKLPDTPQEKIKTSIPLKRPRKILVGFNVEQDFYKEFLLFVFKRLNLKQGEGIRFALSWFMKNYKGQ